MPDVVIQATGSMEAAMQFCLDNSVSISDTPTVGSSMVVSEAALALGDTLVKQYLRKNSIVVGTLNAEYVALPHPGVYSRTITINHTLCGGSDSSNFPVLISITDPSLKTIANGGHVHNSNGYDIQFFADEAGTIKLNWEIEEYDSSAGILIAWVKVPIVSHSTNTIFYMQYGDTTVSTFQGGSTGSVWDSNFMMVLHFPNGTLLSANDATTNGNNGVLNGATANPGVVNGSANFAASGTNYIQVPSSTMLDSNAGTWSSWIKTTVNDVHNEYIWGRVDGGGSANGLMAYLHDGCICIAMKPNTAFTAWSINSSTVIADGNWHHLAIVFNSGGTCTLYIDGTVNGTVTSGLWNFNNQVFRFGLGLDGFWQGYVGDIDEFRASNVNRSADWILTEYNNIKNPGFITVGAEY